MDLSRCSVNSITVRSMPLEQLIPAAVARGVRAIGPWRDAVAATGLTRAATLMRDAGLTASSLCRGGMFTATTARERAAAIDDNRRAIAEAHALGSDVLVLVCGPVVEKDLPGSRNMVRDGIALVLDDARQAGVTLGIEPLHPMMTLDRSCITTLAEANDIAEELGDSVGVVVDAYHVWWDPRLEHELARAQGRIVGFHVSDWVLPINDQLASRGMMGDGCIDLPRLASLVTSAGFGGPIEVEVLSNRWWSENPERVLDVVCQRFVDQV